MDGALGKAGSVSKRSYARGDRFPFLPYRLAVKIQINKIRRRLAIVSDDVAQQDIDNIVIDRDGFAKAWHF